MLMVQSLAMELTNQGQGHPRNPPSLLQKCQILFIRFGTKQSDRSKC